MVSARILRNLCAIIHLYLILSAFQPSGITPATMHPSTFIRRTMPPSLWLLCGGQPGLGGWQ